MQLEEFVTWHLKARGSDISFHNLLAPTKADWWWAWMYWLACQEPELNVGGKGYWGEYNAFTSYVKTCIKAGMISPYGPTSMYLSMENKPTPKLVKPERILN